MKISINIWKLYGFEAEPAASNSPIADVFTYVEKEAEEGETVYVGTGEKDFPRFKVLTDPSFKPENYKVSSYFDARGWEPYYFRGEQKNNYSLIKKYGHEGFLLKI